MNMYEVAGKDWKNGKAKVCGEVPEVCEFIDNIVSGGSEYNDAERYKGTLSKFPNAISWKELSHYAQMMVSGKFARYDYGKTTNLAVYGSKTPPEVDIAGIKSVPIAYFVGKQDALANVEDVKWASELTPTTVLFKEIDNCDHSSYLLGKDMSFLQDVIPLVKKFNPNANKKAMKKLYLY